MLLLVSRGMASCTTGLFGTTAAERGAVKRRERANHFMTSSVSCLDAQRRRKATWYVVLLDLDHAIMQLGATRCAIWRRRSLATSDTNSTARPMRGTPACKLPAARLRRGARECPRA